MPFSYKLFFTQENFPHKHLTGHDADCEYGCKVDRNLIQTAKVECAFQSRLTLPWLLANFWNV